MSSGPMLDKDAISDHVLPHVEEFANLAERWVRDDVLTILQGWLTNVYAHGLRDGWQQCIDQAARDLAAPEEPDA